MAHRFVILISVLLAYSLLANSAVAEDIKNYRDCNVCAGSIHYGPAETKQILGKKGYGLIQLLPESRKKVKIDLDGVQRNGTQNDRDDGYEIVIWGHMPFYIKSLKDQSTIEFNTDPIPTQTINGYDRWRPEIYLYASKSNPIHLDEPLEIAWKKMETSHIHEFVVTGAGGAPWIISLRKRLHEAIGLMAR